MSRMPSGVRSPPTSDLRRDVHQCRVVGIHRSAAGQRSAEIGQPCAVADTGRAGQPGDHRGQRLRRCAADAADAVITAAIDTIRPIALTLSTPPDPVISASIFVTRLRRGRCDRTGPSSVRAVAPSAPGFMGGTPMPGREVAVGRARDVGRRVIAWNQLNRSPRPKLARLPRIVPPP